MRNLLSLTKSERGLLILICLVAAGLLGVDAIDDLSHGSSFEHIAVEAFIVALATLGAFVISFRYIASKRENINIRKDLQMIREDMKRYKEQTQHLMEELSQKIDRQFDSWSLSQAEKEIALLILKGFSIKEISAFRGTSERTITQQVSSIYAKSGLHSRAELSAFFLEDLLVISES